MAEQPDRSERTEEPTPKKIEDALRKGQTPMSREASTFTSMLSILAVFGLMLAGGVHELTGTLAALHDNAGGFDLSTDGDVNHLMMGLVRAVGVFLLPIVALIAAAGLLASFAQASPRIVGDRVRPKLERISPMAGAKRIFGSHGVMEFLRAVFKFVAVGAIAVVLLWNELPDVIRAVFVDPSLLPTQMLAIATRLLAVVCTATIVLVAADLVYTRMKWRRDLRMSRREVKDELKQSEGDPLFKARLRSLQKDRSRQRMLTAVPQATVVIANPTHFAVALFYRREMGGAPKVVAKGVDLVALKIRELAEAAEVPVVENPPLARALYDAAEVDQMIPDEFYRAVAEVLHFIYSRDVAGA